MTQEHIVTVFKNIKQTSTPFHRDVMTVLKRIKDGGSKELVQSIRKEKDKKKRADLKQQLVSICFSGEFTKRADDKLVQHSGLVCLDFDGYKTKQEMQDDKQMFIEDAHTFAVFVSPSGNGLKVLVKIPREPENHINYFNALKTYFNSEYFDTTSRNISRVCYESYDPTMHINEDSDVWETMEEPEYKELDKSQHVKTIPITDSNKIAEILQKWWTKEYPMVEGKRNQHAYVLAAAFNDFGIDKSLCTHILYQYADDSFTQNEIRITIDSAYSQVEKFGTKFYEDEQAISEMKTRLKGGDSPREIRDTIEKKHNLTTEEAEAVLDRIEEETQTATFWTKSEKGKISLIHIEFKKFLEDNGFYKFCPEGGDNYVFVKVTNNLVNHTKDKAIKDFVLDYLYDLDDKSIYNYFADQTRLFKEDFLSMLSTIDIYFMQDSKKEAYLYYKNCAVRITEKKVETIDYLDLGGFVWEDHVIPRNFKHQKVVPCDYSKFIANIAGGDDSRRITMESTIGFLLHGYKNKSKSPAVILNDEVISDNPEGGTGKGLFMKALGHMKKLVTIDGKGFSFEKSFPYQLVSADTQILLFDDVKKHFDFERLFSVITEGMTLEKKNKDAIKLPFEKSPKVAITTNYALKGGGNSNLRRRWELELHQHYNGRHSPEDEFGRLFFGDWDEPEWIRFDNYMISCLQLHLEQGLVQSEFVNLRIRKFAQETNHDFAEWCGLLHNGIEPHPELVPRNKIYKHKMYLNFIAEYPDYGPKTKLTISQIRFNKWLNAFATFKYGIEPEEGRDSDGRWMIIREPLEFIDQQKIKYNE